MKGGATMAHMTGVMTRSLAAVATLALTLAPSAGGPVRVKVNRIAITMFVGKLSGL